MPTSEPSDFIETAATIPAEGECREFRYRDGADERDGFLVRSGGQVFAYRNACPHTGAPLNWSPDRFLTEEGDYIVCALHGALFRIENGLCVAGPCAGRNLEKLTTPPGNGGGA